MKKRMPKGLSVRGRLEWYSKEGFPKKAREDADAGIRLEARHVWGFYEKDKNDVWEEMRLQAYIALGFTAEAEFDRYWVIRLNYYRAHKFNDRALEDVSYVIRDEAKANLAPFRYTWAMALDKVDSASNLIDTVRYLRSL